MSSDFLAPMAAVNIPANVHFDTADGQEVVLMAGLYGVSIAEDGRLDLRGAGSEATAIETETARHGESLTRDVVFVLRGEEIVRLVYLDKDGTRRESVGFVDGIRPRAGYPRTLPREDLPRHVRQARERPVEVSSPSRGDRWTAGETREIRWRASARVGSTVGIALVKDGRLVANIATAAQNNGRYRWTIPPLRSGAYSVVVAGSAGHVAGFSETFTIGPR